MTAPIIMCYVLDKLKYESWKEVKLFFRYKNHKVLFLILQSTVLPKVHTSVQYGWVWPAPATPASPDSVAIVRNTLHFPSLTTPHYLLITSANTTTSTGATLFWLHYLSLIRIRKGGNRYFSSVWLASTKSGNRTVWTVRLVPPAELDQCNIAV